MHGINSPKNNTLIFQKIEMKDIGLEFKCSVFIDYHSH